MHRSWIAALCLLALLVSSGCGARTPAPDYYRLMLPPADATSTLAGLGLVVGPVVIPERLNRNGILLSDSAARLASSERYRWSEPLDEALTQELAWHLGGRAPRLNVFAFPWPAGATPDYQLSLQLSRFEAMTPRQLELAGLVTISNLSTERTLATRRFDFSETISEPGVGGMVEAHGRAAGRLAEHLLELLEDQLDGGVHPPGDRGE